MKKFYFPLLLAASLGLGACSSDNAIDNGGNNSGSTIDLSNGGYVKLNINLPTDKGSRATDLVDGLEKEFAVKDASLLLFKGTTGASEDAATFYAAYDLNKDDFAKNGEDQITITKRITTALGENPNLGANDELYALVVLNNNGIFTVDIKSQQASAILGKVFVKLFHRRRKIQFFSRSVVDKESTSKCNIRKSFCKTLSPA